MNHMEKKHFNAHVPVTITASEYAVGLAPVESCSFRTSFVDSVTLPDKWPERIAICRRTAHILIIRVPLQVKGCQ